MSEIEYLDNYDTIITDFSTGNAFQNMKMNYCYMITSTSYVENEQCSKKRKRDIKNSQVPHSIKNLTPVTIMVVDTIGRTKSRKLLKVLLDSG